MGRLLNQTTREIAAEHFTLHKGMQKTNHPHKKLASFILVQYVTKAGEELGNRSLVSHRGCQSRCEAQYKW